MISRRLILLLVTCLLMSACAALRAGKGTKPDQSADTDANGPSVASAAAKVTDMCSLMPADLVKKTVPNADAPIRDQILKRCSVSNGTSVLEITLETGVITPTDPVNGAEFVPGLALGGYLERLDPKDRGDTYLTVILGKDPNGLLHVEVAGHDGKDHRDDAIAIAKDILAHLR